MSGFTWPKLDNWPQRIGLLVIVPVVLVLTLLGIFSDCAQGFKIGLYPKSLDASISAPPVPSNP